MLLFVQDPLELFTSAHVDRLFSIIFFLVPSRLLFFLFLELQSNLSLQFLLLLPFDLILFGLQKCLNSLIVVRSRLPRPLPQLCLSLGLLQQSLIVLFLIGLVFGGIVVDVGLEKVDVGIVFELLKSRYLIIVCLVSLLVSSKRVLEDLCIGHVVLELDLRLEDFEIELRLVLELVSGICNQSVIEPLFGTGLGPIFFESGLLLH